MSFCKLCGSEMSVGIGPCQSCGARSSVAGEAAAVPVSTASVASSRVLATNVAATLAYLAGFITGIIFLVLDPYKSNSVVRFHAYQSIFFNVAWFFFWIVWIILSAVVMPRTAGIFSMGALSLFAVAGFGISAFLMYQAYQQKLFKLPILGKLAAARAGVRR